MVLQGGVVVAATADPTVVSDIVEEVVQQLEAEAQLELQVLWRWLPLNMPELAMEGKGVAITTMSRQPDYPSHCPRTLIHVEWPPTGTQSGQTQNIS